MFSRTLVARRIREENYTKIIAGLTYLKATLGRLLRSYVLIMCITFLEQAIGLTILGVEYSLLIAMAIAAINIFGGKIYAKGGNHAAGIGGSSNCDDFGIINIYTGLPSKTFGIDVLTVTVIVAES